MARMSDFPPELLQIVFRHLFSQIHDETRGSLTFSWHLAEPFKVTTQVCRQWRNILSNQWYNILLNAV